MPNKPDKFVLKFWLLVEVRSKYLCNGKPYLGKYPTRNRENNLSTDVCLWLIQPFLKKRYNMTMNNYFTSVNLADKIKAEKATLFGTNRKQRKEVRKVEEIIKGKLLYSIKIYQSSSTATLTIHKAKKQNWCVCQVQCTKQFLLIKYAQKNY